MIKKKIGKPLFFILILVSLLLFLYFKFSKENETIKSNKKDKEVVYSSNIIKDVKYNTKDLDGNEYIVTALEGEIDYKDTNTLYLTKVESLIKLQNSDNITITSDYGKYNSENFDTIFSQNVIIKYLDNKITSEYLDFSLDRNSMLISRKVVYTNFENILKADVIEVDIKTKDTNIYMYENNKKVNIKSKN